MDGALPSMISSSSSRFSLPVNALIQEDSNLLAETISLDSFALSSSTESVSVPRFPDGSMVPMATFLKLGCQLSLFPHGSPRIGGFSEAEEKASTTPTVPTAPRLRTMLRENLCVKKWTETLRIMDPPGHIPWGDADDSIPIAWKPEGSEFSPEVFREALMNARQSPSSGERRGLTKGHSPVAPLELRRNPSSRKASVPADLVFERDIYVPQPSGDPQRLSLQVPASRMNTELVDIMLELQDLKAYFQESTTDDLLESGFPANRRTETQVHLQMQSPDASPSCGSGTAIRPTKLGSPSELTNNANPVAIAARRGRKMLAPLVVKAASPVDLEYPGLPSAFLGSPAVPLSDAGEGSDVRVGKPSLRLQDMIGNLRSQCASFPETPNTPYDFVRQQEVRVQQAPGSTWAEDDCPKDPGEADLGASVACWDLVVAQSKKDNGDSLHDLSRSTASFRAMINTPEAHMLNKDDSLDSWNSTPDATPDSNHRIRGRRSFEHGMLGSSRRNRPPSTPLPPRPLSKASMASISQVRGILKSSKSVRFASLPSKCFSVPPPAKPTSEELSEGQIHAGSSLPLQVTDGLLTSPVTPLSNVRPSRPSPLRNTFAASPVASSARSQNGSVTRRPPTASKRPGLKLQRRRVTMDGIAQITMNPSETQLHTRERRSQTVPASGQAEEYTPHSNRLKRPVPSSNHPSGRHSLGGPFVGQSASRQPVGTDKENRPRHSMHPTSTFSSGWAPLTTDIQSQHQRDGPTTKVKQPSRMPVPLRNIFTRFK
ncbi:hypothetical protein HGRIS_005014 [Hohenbuehelia grisea]|uniref:Uncharacterized protein n=1 Tax=Hohenbuehelia grisea TaxID=104357 RepID=A0ABR3JDQ0_9AGAR